MKRRTAVGLGPLLALLIAGPAQAQQQADGKAIPSITVDGSASTTLVPDGATLSLGVETTRPTAREAVEANSRALERALATLKARGVPADAVTTTAVDLSAVFDEPKTGTPTVIGYHARNEIEARLQVSQSLGALIAAVIDDGVNSMDGLRFSSSAEAAARDRLKGEAARAARHDAETYASALGLQLGRVLAVRPDGAPGVPFRTGMPLAARAASVPVPIAPGRLDVAERVSVTFELVP